MQKHGAKHRENRLQHEESPYFEISPTQCLVRMCNKSNHEKLNVSWVASAFPGQSVTMHLVYNICNPLSLITKGTQSSISSRSPLHHFTMLLLALGVLHQLPRIPSASLLVTSLVWNTSWKSFAGSDWYIRNSFVCTITFIRFHHCLPDL